MLQLGTSFLRMGSGCLYKNIFFNILSVLITSTLAIMLQNIDNVTMSSNYWVSLPVSPGIFRTMYVETQN